MNIGVQISWWVNVFKFLLTNDTPIMLIRNEIKIKNYLGMFESRERG